MWKRLPGLLLQLLLVGAACALALGGYVLLVLWAYARLAPSNPRAAEFVLLGGLWGLLGSAVLVVAALLTGSVLPPWRTQRHTAALHVNGPQVDAEAVRRKVFAAANMDVRLLEQRRAWFARLSALGLVDLLRDAPVPWPLPLLQRLPSWGGPLPALGVGELMLLVGAEAQQELYRRELAARLVADEHTP